jgi:4-amino-4-deoxy-L-arabinose transferase-like glycosyltransferase
MTSLIPRFTGRREVMLVGILILISVAAALPVLTYPMGRDQGMYANIARTILNGGLPYIDMWDIKPPAIYYIYAAGISVFGSGAAAIRAIDLVFLPFTLLAIYLLGRRIGETAGAGFLSGVLFTVFYFTETFASLTQSDSLVTLPMSVAALCVVYAGDAPRASRRALLWAAAAGGLSATTIWFKHYYALFVLAIVIEHLLRRMTDVRNSESLSLLRRFPVREALAFAMGGLPVGALPLLYFLSNGVFAEMMVVAQGTSHYNAQAAVSLQTFISQMENYVRFRWWHWGVLLVLAVLWFVAPDLKRREWRIVWLWLLAAFGFVLIQAKGFDTHWIPMLPPLALLAGGATDGILRGFASRFLGNRRVVTTVIYAVVCAALLFILLKDTWVRAYPLLTGEQDLEAYYADQSHDFQGNDFKPWESLRLVRYLERRTQPGNSLFIFGFRPEIYYLSGLQPATRFQAQFPLVADWWPPEWRQEAVDDLWASLPPYVLILQADYMDWVTGKKDQDSATLMAHDERLQDLEDWLIFNYQEARVIGDFRIWERKDLAATAAEN